MSITKKIFLNESDMPEYYYNIQADMPNPTLPPLHPGTKEPIGPEDLAPLFPMELIKQEVSQERFIEIPDEVQNIYKLYRPSPLYRATGLEKLLDTPAKIYYKYEGVSPTGSHKPNTAIAQAFYNKKEGAKKLATETGAGQWGSALSFACAQFGLECEVYMVKISYDQKPYRKVMMNTFGAEVISSPSNRTNAGKQILEQDPNSPGSLGIAISEAVERAVTEEGTNYSLGSVLNHVLMHQTVIGQEAIKQMEIAGDFPDLLIAPLGGGSNFAGLAFPFLRYNFQEDKKIRCIAVEPHTFVPQPIHAGGLRYHGAGAIISQLLKDKIIEASALQQIECFEAGIKFSISEGIIPAPEATHGIAQVIREALKAKVEGTKKTILFNLSGHGYFDMSAYQDYLAGNLSDHELTEEELYSDLKKLDTPEAA